MDKDKPQQDPKNQQEQKADQSDATEAEHITRSELSELVEKKISAHLSRFRGAFSKDVEGMMTRAVAPIAEQLAGVSQAKPEQAVPDPERTKLEARLKDMESKLEAERKTREGIEAARMAQEERTGLSSGLSTAGVTGPYLKAAMALLYAEEKRVVRDDKGSIRFRIQRDGYEDLVDLDQGLAEWLKTDEGKAFMPPRNVQGSGTTPGKPAASRKTVTKEEAKAEAMRQLVPALIAASNR